MADDQQPTDPTKPANYEEIATQIARALVLNLPQGQMAQWITGVTVDRDYNGLAVAFKLASEIAIKFATAISQAEASSDPAFANLAASAVEDLLGVNVSRSAFAGRSGRGARVNEMDRIARSLLDSLGGPKGPIEPTDQPALKYLATLLSFSIEGWLEGWVFELLSSVIPGIDKIETFSELDDILASVLGLGSLSSRVVSPLIDATVVTPMQWKVNQTYRPNLLTPRHLVRQIARGTLTREKAVEELALQGYADWRADALLNVELRSLPVSDLDLLIRAGRWTLGSAVAHLQDAGYEASLAETELQLEEIRRIATNERAMANAAVDGYVGGRITEGEMGGFLTGVTISPREKAQYTELAAARRICARKPLSSSEAEQCVKAGVLTVRDYRAALVREGRTDEAVAALELLLRWEMDKAKQIAEHRREQAEERAAEKAERERLAEAKRLEVEASRALRRRGPTSRLEAIATRGGIPIERVAELYAAEFDPDTVAILVDDLVDRRAAYVERETAAERTRAKAAQRSIDVGSLERAVTEGVLTLAEFRQRLAQLGFNGDDAALLTDTLDARLDARADAQRAREEAAAAAKVRRIDLGRFETLVRRGHRTVGQYAALVASLGFDEAAQAAMVELLQVQIADDAAAAQLRAEAAAKLRAKGLSLEQFRRAVVLGLTPIDAYGPFLLGQGFTADAVKVLVAELQHDVDEAVAARARRADADRRSQAGRAPLSDVRRAARLGLVPIATYTARLTAAGYPDEDVALEVDLLAEEIATLTAAREERAAAERAARERGIPLAQEERRVRAGLATIETYTATARAAGFSEAAAAAMGALLEHEIAAAAAIKARREELAAAAAIKHASLAQLEAAVLEGVSTLAAYTTALRGLGYADEDVELLTRLVDARVARQQAARARERELDAANGPRALARADVVKGVLAGLRSLDDYAGYLTAQGYADEDVALLVDLVIIALDMAAAKAAGPSEG